MKQYYLCRRPVISLSHATKSYRVNRPQHKPFGKTLGYFSAGSARYPVDKEFILNSL